MDASDIRKRSLTWMAKNFEVVEMFEKFAIALKARDRRFGVNLLRERVRWECVYEHGDDYKFPNEFSPYIARFLLWLHPELKGNMTCHLSKDEQGEVELITAHHIWPNLFEAHTQPSEFPIA